MPAFGRAGQQREPGSRGRQRSEAQNRGARRERNARRWRVALPVALALVVAALGAAAWWQLSGGGRTGGGAVGSVAADPSQPAAEAGPVEQLPDEGARHVPLGAPVTYRTDPPASGPHYDGVAQPGFYRDRAPSYGYLVHNLEHGHVVIYYHPQRLQPQELAYLEELTRRYRGAWDAVLAVPRQDPQYAVILTAWRHRQRLGRFDRAAVDAFVDRFRGRGPENPVR